MEWLNVIVRLFLWENTSQKGEAIILTTSHATPPSVEALKDLIEQSLDADKAEDITIIDLQSQSALADYMVVATGTSSRHIAALANKLKDRLETRGIKGIRIEGLAQSDWVAIDTGDIIVHLFREEVREFYNIEKMWLPLKSFEGDGAQISA